MLVAMTFVIMPVAVISLGMTAAAVPLARRMPMAMRAVRLVLVVIATAMVAHAQLMDMLGARTGLCDLVDDVALAMVAVRAVNMRRVSRSAQHRTAKRRVHAGVFAQHTDKRVDDKARDGRHNALEEQNARHARHRHVLGHQHGEHLVRGAQKYRHKRTEGHDASRIECGRHGRKAALWHHTQHGTHGRPRRAGALDKPVDARARGVLKRLERDVGDEQKRNERQRVVAGVH